MAKKREETKREGLSIPELKAKWAKEKDYYAEREVGTGVQIFVKDVLKSPDVFALKVGLNSTKLENRKDEFLEENDLPPKNCTSCDWSTGMIKP